ncbi:MAG: SDR family oxidoreductase [Thermodesulfobacteriota bacterium]|nr:SDR family oxidoreductase [Thermodesulfobacteriota bacterium]
MNVLVTGGASGLGRAITRRLGKDKGICLYFTYCDSLVEAQKIEQALSNATAMRCDFYSKESVDELTTKMGDMDLDVLVNNAMPGMTEKHFHKMEADVFCDSFRNAVMPTIRITQCAITLFRKRKFGKIITVLTSALINRPPIGWSEYVANKAYLHSLSKSWAVENAKFNITSNCVSPSLMRTELTKGLDDRIVEDLERNHPLKRLLTTEEAAEALWLLLRATQHLNGANLLINSASDVI